MEHVSRLDPRIRRLSQGVLAIALLAGFVFRQPWVLAVTAVLAGLGAALGPSGNVFVRLWGATVGPRLDPPRRTEAAEALRVADLIALALLTVATLCWLIGLEGLGWLFGLIEAAIGAVEGGTGAAFALWLWERAMAAIRR